MKHRKRIAVGEEIPLELTERERDLIMNTPSSATTLPTVCASCPAPASGRFIVSPWTILMNWRATSRQKQTTQKSRNSRRSFVSCTVGSQTPWNPIRMSPTNPRIKRTTTADESYLSG